MAALQNQHTTGALLLYRVECYIFCLLKRNIIAKERTEKLQKTKAERLE